MPLLGGLLVSLFGGSVAWLAAYFTRKVAFVIASTATFTVITVALYVAMRLSLSAVSAGIGGVPALMLMTFQMAFPPAAFTVLSAWVTVWTACTVYHWQRDLLHIAINA